MRYCKEVIFAALLFAPCASAQVVVVSAVWNQSLESIKIEGSIDPAIDAIAIEVHATHLAHHSLPDPTFDSVHLWRATVDDYYSYNSRHEGLLDGSTQLNVTVPIRWDPISVNKVVIKEHQPSTVVIDEYLDVSIICPSQGDFSFGAPTTTDCMPETDRQVFLEEEFFDSQGTSVRRLIDPAVWCRADLIQQRLYWPREAGANCSVWPQAQIDMSTAANASRQYWEGLGCQDWYKPYTVTFEVEFTPILMDFTGGAFSPLMSDGHIFINSASVQASEDFRVGAVLHELAHAAVQFSIFPSAIADEWGQSRLWPEAIATAAMIANMPGSGYWADLHGPFPGMWKDGLTFGRNKARHAALLILYLQENEGFNSCQFMLDNHSSLLNGDEVGAFLNAVPWFRYKFADFVFAYNTRMPSIPGIEMLSAPVPFVLSQPGPNALAVLNGIKDGETFLFTISEPRKIAGAYWKHSTRCPGYTFNRATHRPDGTKVSEQTYTEASTNAVNMYFHDPGTYSITISSPEGTAHMEEFVISELDRSELPASPWPAPALDDPYPSGCP